MTEPKKNHNFFLLGTCGMISNQFTNTREVNGFWRKNKGLLEVS